MMLSRRLMMGKGRTTYVWEFDVEENAKGNLEFLAVAGDHDFTYSAGTDAPDLFTSTFTVPSGSDLTIQVIRGAPGATSILSRGYVGLVLVGSLRSTSSFYTNYPFKPGATIELYNVTEGVVIESWDGTDTHVDGFLDNAGHFFFPSNQNVADSNANGMIDFNNTTDLTDGDVAELRITV
jgi:hypothetical protein